MRLFVAINFNDIIKDALADLISDLKTAAVAGNYTDKQNLHLTLAFIGETDKISDAVSAVAGINAYPFSLSIEKTGVFRRNGGDIYWVGVKKTDALLNIQKQASDNLRKSGFVLEDKEFKPHITLGREVILPQKFNINVPNAEMDVARISLMKSERVRGKLVYSEVYGKDL